MTQLRIRRPTAHGPIEIDVDLDDAAIERILVNVIRDPAALSLLPVTPDSHQSTRQPNGSKRTPPISDAEALKLKEKVPSTSEVADFIRSRPGRAHSLKDVSTHFLGILVRGNSTSHVEKQLFWRIQDRLIAARHAIEREDKSGKFVDDGIRMVGHSRVYTWKVA